MYKCLTFLESIKSSFYFPPRIESFAGLLIHRTIEATVVNKTIYFTTTVVSTLYFQVRVLILQFYTV